MWDINDIEKGLDRLCNIQRKGVQSNSESAEETSATSEALSAQSEILRDLVAQFELKK